jgi:hypothetical protein
MQDDVTNGGASREVLLFVAGMGTGGFVVALLIAVVMSGLHAFR